MGKRNREIPVHAGSDSTISTSQSQLEMSPNSRNQTPPKNDGSVESETDSFVRDLALRNGMLDT